MRAIIPILRLFFRLPVLTFKLAGMIRITNRAKRGFKRALLEDGLSPEVVDELVRDFDPASPVKNALLRAGRR